MTDLEIPETGAVFTFGKSRFAENKPSHFFIKNDPVVHVACGDEHTAVICKNGRIFAFGSNEWGQLGLGHNNMVHKPSCIKALKPEKAKFIACGRAHTIILTESNNIYACGSNTDGQLGLENIDMINTPTKLQQNQLKENGTIKKLSAGSQHSAALTESGLVFVWGSNSEGQLGLESNKTSCKLPTLLEFKDKVRDISCGYYHTAVLTETGQLFTFGENENGKLGLPQGESQTYKPTRVNIDLPLTSLSCGGNHNFGLTEDGTAIAFGSNVHGELGFDKDVTWVSEPRILPQELFENEKLYMIACGDNHTAFITETFNIFTCGDPRHGKLCQDDNSEEGHFGPTVISRFNGYKVTNVSCGGCHTIICAQKIPEDTNSVLPPLQRIPNSILHSESKTDLAGISPSPDNLVNGSNEVKTCAEISNEIVHEVKVNGISEINNTGAEVIQDVQDTTEDGKIAHKMAALSSEIENLPDDISDIIKSQKEQLDAEYDKTMNTLKTESKTVVDEVTDKTNQIKTCVKENTQNVLDETSETVKSGVDKLSDITGMKSLKDHLPSDSVDNLLQEIEDDLSSKSGKTLTSDTVSVKSIGKQSTPIKEVERTEELKTPDAEKDDEDLKTEAPMPQTEKKISKLFGTFKRKKVTSTATLDSKILDVEDKIGSKISLDNKKEEITNGKTDKTKTCTIL